MFARTYSLPRDITIREVAHEPLAQVLPSYDANENNELEKPELNLLYVTEAARGLGYDIVAVGTNPRLSALVAAPADIGGLLDFIANNQSRFSPRSKHLFRNLEQVAAEQELDSPGPDDSFVPPS